MSLLGYGDLSAAAVGVEADLTLVDLSIPINATARAKGTGGAVTLTESLDAELQSTLLKGSLDVYFKTVLPLDGEKLWDWDADEFSFTILDFDGSSYKTSLFKKTQSQKL